MKGRVRRIRRVSHARAALRKAYAFASRAWPLSVPGTATIALAVFMWVRSSGEENAAGLAFPIFLALVVFASVVATRAWNAAPWVARCSWERGEPLRQGENPRAFRVSAPSDHAPFPFVRVNFAASGTLSSASCAVFRVSVERRARPGESAEIAMPLPVSGEISLRAGFVVRDALGLARRRVGARQAVDEAVFPATGQEFPPVDPDESSSSERNAVSKRAEAEKIFIREYVPGDLARDVNWKALARTGLLLTRVPPESPKETRVIRVAFVSPARSNDPYARGRSLVAIDHLRALASSFLLAVRDFSPDYAFALTVGEREFFADAGDSLDGLFDALSRAGFAPAMGNKPAIPEGAWVFADASDPASRAVLADCADSGCQLVVSVGPHALPRFRGPRSRGPRSGGAQTGGVQSSDAQSGSVDVDRAWHVLSLSSCVPFALPLPSVLASLVPSRATDSGQPRLPGTAFVVRHCGVRI